LKKKHKNIETKEKTVEESSEKRTSEEKAVKRVIKRKTEDRGEDSDRQVDLKTLVSSSKDENLNFSISYGRSLKHFEKRRKTVKIFLFQNNFKLSRLKCWIIQLILRRKEIKIHLRGFAARNQKDSYPKDILM
jgi:hypothetical protein